MVKERLTTGKGLGDLAALPRARGPGTSAPMEPVFDVTVTRDPDGVRQAQALRHAVFVTEMGGASGGCDGLEADPFDAHCEHLLVCDPSRPDLGAVATLRLGYGQGGYYTEQEFDLAPLHALGGSLAETGRTCLHPDYRGGAAAFVLFRAMLAQLQARNVAVLVGTASFPGRTIHRHMDALRRLRQEALAPAAMRPKAQGPQAVAVEGDAPRSAMRTVPPLIKTYLRAGAWVGDGAWVDTGFNTVDVCMVLDMARVRVPRAAHRHLGGTLAT
ncbi:MAG: GNAT family N-acyltransferase [Pseudomonadota bacterium]